MGIAGNIFWVVIGLLYILYQAFKEKPAETAASCVVGGVAVAAIIGFILLTNCMTSISPILGSVFVLVAVGLLLYKMFKESKKQEERRRQFMEEYERKIDAARETMTEKDYEDFASRNALRYYGASMNKDLSNYWKNEPYCSKIRRDAEREREFEIAKAARLEKNNQQ